MLGSSLCMILGLIDFHFYFPKQGEKRGKNQLRDVCRGGVFWFRLLWVICICYNNRVKRCVFDL